MEREAVLIVAASEQDANLYYVTQFWAPDPFIFVQINGRRILVMSDLEVDRAKGESKVDDVLSFSKLQAEVKKRKSADSGMTPPPVFPAKGGSDQRSDRPEGPESGGGVISVVDHLFKRHKVTKVRVPSTFPVTLADSLRAKKYTLEVVEDPFFPERMIKKEEEVAAIRETQRFTEAAVQSAIDLIQSAEIKNGDLWLKGQPLTSELIRKVLHLTLMGSDCLAKETIVAGGTQACDPHCIGSGPLKANQPIVLDVFPVSLRTRYFADMTRTVVKGRASPKVKKMYKAVQEGQEIAFRKLKAGVNGLDIHRSILTYFEKEGFKTGLMKGRMQGFFHGTGHGVGLEIHEPPRVSSTPDILQEGNVVTVEPGLYYLDAGGIRLEDMVLITKTGCQNLTTFPKLLELD